MSTVNPQLDALLTEYFGPRSLWDQLLKEDETNALLGALLMEMRGETSTTPENEELRSPAYYATEDVAVDSSDEDTEKWGFAADTVVIYDFSEPITVAFKEPNRDNREIPLTPTQDPFQISTTDGIQAPKVWYRLPNDTAASTSFNVLALR